MNLRLIISFFSIGLVTAGNSLLSITVDDALEMAGCAPRYGGQWGQELEVNDPQCACAALQRALRQFSRLLPKENLAYMRAQKNVFCHRAALKNAEESYKSGYTR